jgi:hypothetical protein
MQKVTKKIMTTTKANPIKHKYHNCHSPCLSQRHNIHDTKVARRPIQYKVITTTGPVNDQWTKYGHYPYHDILQFAQCFECMFSIGSSLAAW